MRNITPIFKGRSNKSNCNAMIGKLTVCQRISYKTTWIIVVGCNWSNASEIRARHTGSNSS